MKRRPENNDDDGESADDYPYGVATSVAGLRVTDGVADSGGSVSDSVDRAVDGVNVDDFPEDIFGEPDQRTNDCRGVEFVHVIFIAEGGVNPAQGFCQLFGFTGLSEVEPEGDEEADRSGKDRDASQGALQRARRLH